MSPDKYITTQIVDRKLIYLLRPYVHEFLQAIEPYYKVIAFSNM